jgi:protein-disulfide isomerase
MECVYRQDNSAFWNIKSKIFDNQDSLDTSNAESQIISWAEEEGVSESSINTCLESEDVAEEIQQDMRDGGRLGTPTIFIGKTAEDGTFTASSEISGAQPFFRFEDAIESELEG